MPEKWTCPLTGHASEASAYVNGFTVAIDGGWLAR